MRAGAEFAFFLHNVAELDDDWRRFTLSADDIAALNPNTGTMATFRSVRDAEITKAIYRRVPVLIRESPHPKSFSQGERVLNPAVNLPSPTGRGAGGEGYNPWGITFKQGLFNMTSDSGKFRTRDELESAGYVLVGNHFVRGQSPHPKSFSQGEKDFKPDHPPLLHMGEEGGRGDEGNHYLPLYEAKMMHQFTHRWATYNSSPLHLGEGRGGEGLTTRDMTLEELQDPSALPIPRYWVDALETRTATAHYEHDWILSFRNVARSTDEKTGIFGMIPFAAVGNSSPVILGGFDNLSSVTGLVSNLSSFTFDFVVRQKVGGINFNFYIVQQLPVIPPHTYTPALLDFIVPRVLELTYTAWDLQAFAQDVGYHGAPFVWDEERRFLMRCELDALYFHLYQIPRDDVDYIMETFPIVKRKDEAKHGEYLTKRIILEMVDQMAGLPVMHAPAPKDEHSTYNVPDISQWQTWLNPPPADASVAHPDERE